jgi:hypothetical protein
MADQERSVDEILARLKELGISPEEALGEVEARREARSRAPEEREAPTDPEGDEAVLDRKGALKPCEACGGDFVALDLRGFIQLVNQDLSLTPGSGGEMLMAMCRNCGLMRLHSTTLLFGTE